MQHNTNTNLYLKSLLNPFQTGDITIPDLDMSRSTCKSLVLNFDEVLPGDRSKLLILYLPHSYRAPIKLFLYDDFFDGYIWWKDVDYDEDLTESYEAYRLVSAGISTISNTISAGNFSIQGSINAIQFETIPDLATLTWNRLTSYKYDNINVVSSLPASVGVTAIAAPTGRARFRAGTTDSVTGVVDQLQITYEMNGGYVDGWVNPAVSTGWFEATVGNGLIPPNLWGKLHYSICMRITSSSQGAYTIVFRYRQINSSNGAVEENLITQNVPFVDGNFNKTGNWVATVDLPGPLLSIEIEANNATHRYDYADLIITSYEYYLTGTRGPGSMIGYEGVTPNSQKIGISAKANYEVIPNSQLIRNVPIRSGHFENPMEMELAETFFSLSTQLGVPTIAASPDYNAFLRGQRFAQVTDNQFLAQASGFTDFIRGMWSAVKPMLRTALPVLGGSIAGPSGSMIGTGLSGLLGESSAYNDEEIIKQIQTGYRGSKPNLPNYSVPGQTSAFRLPNGRASSYDHKWFEQVIEDDEGLFETIMNEMRLCTECGYYCLQSGECPCVGIEMEEMPKGKASFIGDANWYLATTRLKTPELVDGANPGRVEFSTNLVPIRQNVSLNRDHFMRGIEVAPEQSRNSFPVLQGAVVYPGLVEVSDEPFMNMRNAPVYLHENGDHALFIYVNAPEIDEEAMSAIQLAFDAALASRAMIGLPYKTERHLNVACSIGFEGASLGFAAYCSLIGRSLPMFLTGAVTIDSSGMTQELEFYQARDVSKKLIGVRNLGFGLAAVTDEVMLKRDEMALRSYKRLQNGLFMRDGKLETMFSVMGTDCDITILSQMPLEIDVKKRTEREPIQQVRFGGIPAMMQDSGKRRDFKPFSWDDYSDAVKGTHPLYTELQRTGRNVVAEWEQRANDEKQVAAARARARKQLNELVEFLEKRKAQPTMSKNARKRANKKSNVKETSVMAESVSLGNLADPTEQELAVLSMFDL